MYYGEEKKDEGGPPTARDLCLAWCQAERVEKLSVGPRGGGRKRARKTLLHEGKDQSRTHWGQR